MKNLFKSISQLLSQISQARRLRRKYRFRRKDVEK
jgi:hypothetical protein